MFMTYLPVKITKVISLFLMIAAIFSACVPDQMREYPSGWSDYPNKSYFKINPETILDSINQARINIFVPLAATPTVYENAYPPSVMWRQTDYLKVANALFQHLWNETPDNWNLYQLLFYGDCGYDSIGFDIAHITYFKAIGMNQYTTREIHVFPSLGEVDAGANANFPRALFGWRSVNLDNLKISADDALQAAEEHGGKMARMGIENRCRVSVELMPDTQNSGWHVEYKDMNAKTIFELAIDPYTGFYLP
jgi:hypothetical protein